MRAYKSNSRARLLFVFPTQIMLFDSDACHANVTQVPVCFPLILSLVKHPDHAVLHRRHGLPQEPGQLLLVVRALAVLRTEQACAGVA